MTNLEELWKDAKKCYDAGVEAAVSDWNNEEGALDDAPLPEEDDPFFLQMKVTYPDHFSWLEMTWSSGYVAKYADLENASTDDSRKISRAELNKLKEECFELGKEAAEADLEDDELEESPTPNHSPTMFNYEHEYPFHYSVLVEYWREGYYERADELKAQEANAPSTS